jgi:hypothetical protein
LRFSAANRPVKVDGANAGDIVVKDAERVIRSFHLTK